MANPAASTSPAVALRHGVPAHQHRGLGHTPVQAPRLRVSPTAAAGAMDSGEPSPAAHSGPSLSVEGRQRRQRLQAELHQRAHAAASAGRAYNATLEQRERQRAAVAAELERQTMLRAAAAARHVPVGAAARRAAAGAAAFAGASTASGVASGGAAAGAAAFAGAPAAATGATTTSGAAAGAAAFAGASAAGSSAQYFLRYTRRLYDDAEPDADDVWGARNRASVAAAFDAAGFNAEGACLEGRGAASDQPGDHMSSQPAENTAAAFRAAATGTTSQGAAAAGSASAQGQAAYHRERSEHDIWTCVNAHFSKAEQAYRSFTAAEARRQQQRQQARQHQQEQQQQARQQRQQQQQRQRWRWGGGQRKQQPVVPAGWAAGAASASLLEQEVRAELTATLTAAGGDLARFVSELGIAFEAVGGDRARSLRAARAAALQRFHPDKLRQAGEREQVYGLLATQLLNELWHAERARAV